MNNTLDHTTSTFPSSTAIRRQRRFVFAVAGLAVASSLFACTANNGGHSAKKTYATRFEVESNWCPALIP